MNVPQDKLVGYWVIDSAPEDKPESFGEIYLRFTGNGLLQWGYQDEHKIYINSFEYWLENKKIVNTCPPNPRKELTPFAMTDDDKLKINYSNYETIWRKTSKQDFFESNDIWDAGRYNFRRLDYMSELELSPSDFQIKRAEYLGVSPQIIINTDSLWHAWEYSRGEFASFHSEEFKYILKCGVLVDKTCQQDLTLLMYIISDGYIEVIEAMLENGFDINAEEMCGMTPLDFAVFHDQTEIYEMLRQRGAKLGSELKTAKWLKWNSRNQNRG